MAPPTWPTNTLDLVTALGFLALVLLVPAAGYVFMAIDFRAYLRTLKRGLIVVSQTFRGIPQWAQHQTPRSVAALGLMMPCTVEELKEAYRRKVMQLHPDRGGDERRFMLLQADFEQALAFLNEQAEDRRHPTA